MTQESVEAVDFIHLYNQHTRRVYAYIRRVIYRQAEAEELFQETSKTLWEKFDSFEPGSNFGAWAITIARHKLLNHRRRQIHSPFGLSEDLIDRITRATIAESDMLERRHRALASCYNKLSEPDRKLVDLRYEAGLPVPAIAEQTGRSVDFVYKHLRRIHEALFTCITRNVSTEETE